MKRSAVYQRAAWLIEKNYERFACNAIVEAKGRHFDTPAEREFAEYFKPLNRSIDRPWFGQPSIEQNRDHRVIALCLMAAIAESEGK